MVVKGCLIVNMSPIKIGIVLSALALFITSSIGIPPWYSLNVGHELMGTGRSNFGDYRVNKSSAGVQLADNATVCVTPQGSCPAPPNMPKGSPCQCSSAAGTFYGVAR